MESSSPEEVLPLGRERHDRHPLPSWGFRAGGNEGGRSGSLRARYAFGKRYPHRREEPAPRGNLHVSEVREGLQGDLPHEAGELRLYEMFLRDSPSNVRGNMAKKGVEIQGLYPEGWCTVTWMAGANAQELRTAISERQAASPGLILRVLKGSKVIPVPSVKI